MEKKGDAWSLHPARGLPTCTSVEVSTWVQLGVQYTRPKRPTVYKPTQVTHKPAYPTTQGVGASTYPVLGGFSIAPWKQCQLLAAQISKTRKRHAVSRGPSLASPDGAPLSKQ